MFLEAQIKPIKTVLHIIRYPDGTGMSEQTALEAIEILNDYYTDNNTNIKFFVDQTIITNTPSTTFNFDFVNCYTIDPQTTLPNLVNDALNIYFFPNIMDGVIGVTVNVPGNKCIVKYGYTSSSTIAHEVGHCFGLYHTDEICFGYENVTRVITQNCTPNCDDAGDKICDTHAQRNPNGSSVDNCNTSYPTENPNYGNIMDYQTGTGDRYYFTSGQKQRMQYILQSSLYELIFDVNVIASNKINEVNQSGTTLHFDGEQVYSGHPINLLYGIPHISRTDEEIISFIFKHHDWDDDYSQFRLAENYIINKNFLFRTANFDQLYPTTIKNCLIEVSNSDLGTKEMKDPWWLDGIGNQPDEFRELTSPNVNIFLNQEYDPTGQNPFYKVRSPIQQPYDLFLSQTGRYHKFYFYNWGWSGTDDLIQNEIVNGYYETPVVFRSTNATVTANLKGTQLSNYADAYKNNSQRKFARTPDGKMYITYESMNCVWLERSTNDGSSWEIMNNGNPIGNTEGISPCLDYEQYTSNIVLSYQEKIGSFYKLKYVVYSASTGNLRYGDVEWNYDPMESLSYSHDTKMVVCWNGSNEALFIWKGNNQFLYSLCILNPITTSWYDGGAGIFGNSDYNTPAIYTVKYSSASPRYFHLAYQVSNREIHYRLLKWDAVEERFTVGALTNVSANSGYGNHYNPTITGTDWVIGESRTTYIRLAWRGYRDAYEDNPPCALLEGESRVLYKFKAPGYWSSFFVYGDYVTSVSINKGTTVMDDWEPVAIAWSEGVNCDWPNKYIRSHESPPLIHELTTTGSEIQVNNSSDFTNMYVNSFNRGSLPYYFMLSENLSGGLEKTESISILKAREGVVNKDSTDFYYAVGDINVNGEIVDFVEMPDSLDIVNTQLLNQYLISNPFSVTDNSILTYGVQYGVTDSASAVNALSDSTTIAFRVELVDNQTGEVLGVFDNVTFNSENVLLYNNIGYQVDLTGIGNRTLIFKLVVTTNAECDYSISNRFSDSETLNKGGYKHVTYKGNLPVKDYALEQNFPNPFNPTTTIKYQIPKQGNVTIKVYDILGSEVATLINDQQNKGRYEVKFDAGSLASGVYLYRLSVNDFESVKKMVLLR